MNELIFKKLPSTQRIGNGLFLMNRILRFNQDPEKTSLGFDPVKIAMEYADNLSDKLLEPGTYMVNCLIRLSDGSIHPGITTISHTSSYKNEAISSFIFSTEGSIPLQHLDEEQETLFVHYHEILELESDGVFTSPFKNITLLNEQNSTRIIIHNIPDQLITTETSEPLTLEEEGSFPFDLNYWWITIGDTEYSLRTRKGEDLNYDFKQVKFPVLMKFANGIQTLGMVYYDVNTKMPLFFSVLDDHDMIMLTKSNYQKLLGIDSIEELCPFQVFNFDYNEQKRKVELQRIYEIDSMVLSDILEYADECIDKVHDSLK